MENATLAGSVTRALGYRIKCLRKAHHLTQEGMAEQFDVSRQTVQKWESGESIPVYCHLRALKAYFCVSADYILFGSDDSADMQTPRTNNAPANAGAL